MFDWKVELGAMQAPWRALQVRIKTTIQLNWVNQLHVLTLQSTPELLKRFHERFTFAHAKIGKQFRDLFFVFRAARG